MANKKFKREENNPNSVFYVDDSCIDCGTCYWMAPKTFKRVSGQSVAFSEDQTSDENLKGMNALLSCPTNSIGQTTSEKISHELPSLIEDNVFHLGFHSERSFGGTPYYIDAHGGIMIDCPRFNNHTVMDIKSKSGLSTQLLTHKDGIADTNRFHDEFGSKRMIHQGDQNNRSENWEQYFKGEKDIQIYDDLIVIPTPGHTKGSVCYLYKNKFLFTGDHLCFSRNLDQLVGFKNHCWYSIEHLIQSMEKLLNYTFSWILPEHGSPFNASPSEMKTELKKCIKYLKI